jgi:fibronectin type 3 domain-containing protein
LEKGVYPISVAYFQYNKVKSFKLLWSNPDVFGDTLLHEVEDKYFINGSIPADSIPVKPTSISASLTSYNKVKLTWSDKSNNETGFQIYRSLRPVKDYKIIYTTNANQTSYIDSNLSPQTRYYYKVNAVNNYGTSLFTDTTSKLTGKEPSRPLPPQDFEAVALSSSSIKLSWTDVETTETNYQILRSMSDSLHFKTCSNIAC